MNQSINLLLHFLWWRWFDSSSISTFLLKYLKSKSFRLHFVRLLFLMMKILRVNCIVFKAYRIHWKTCIVPKMQKFKFRTNAIAYCSCITKGKFHSFVRYFFFTWFLQFHSFHLSDSVFVRLFSFSLHPVLPFPRNQCWNYVLLQFSYCNCLLNSFDEQFIKLNPFWHHCRRCRYSTSHLYQVLEHSSLSFYLLFYLKHPFHCFHFGIVLFFMYK